MDNNGNILVIGNSGAGKSTLINAVIGSEEAYAEPSIGGATEKMNAYSSSEIPFTLLDTMGFDEKHSRSAIKQVKDWLKEGIKKGEEEKQLNLIWFCIDGSSGRIFPETIKNMLKATSDWKTVPIVAVITKSIHKPHIEQNISNIKEAFNEYSKDPDRLKDVIPVVAKDFDLGEGNFAPTEGIEELIEVSNSLMPEGIKAASNDVDTYILKRKRIFAHGLTGTATAGAAVIGAVPLPLADAALLTPLESGMLIAISKIYGIKKDDSSKVFIKTIVDTSTVSIGAKALISTLKAMPGINIAVSVLNAVIAGVIVAAVGEVSVYAYEQVYLGKKDIDDINWIRNKIEKALASTDLLNKIEKVLKKIGKTDDLKKIANIIFKEFFKEKK